MTAEVRITVTGAENLGKLSERLQPALDQLVKDVALSMQSLAAQKAPVDQGLLRASILQPGAVEVHPMWAKVTPLASYAAAVEEGSKPHMPPVEPLIGWAHRKGIGGVFSVKSQRRLGSKATQEAQDIRAGWALAMHIKKFGTKAHPYLKPAVGDLPKVLPSLVRKFVARLRGAR